MQISGIYGILPANIPLEKLLGKAEAALRGGVRTLQLRDKKASLNHKYSLERAEALHALVRTYDGCFIVNDCIRLALEVGADGVHLGWEDIKKSIVTIRAEAKRPLVIGVSCKGDATNISVNLQLSGQAEGACCVMCVLPWVIRVMQALYLY